MQNKDFYAILNVSKDATEEEIKKSYKKLALLYHPDKNRDNNDACDKFKEIAEAYSVLGNKEKRSQYDVMGCVDDNFQGEDPFSVFNNIFKQHMGNFMNMRYEDNINVDNIFNKIPGMSGRDFNFGNIGIKVHTFPSNIFEIHQEDDYANIEDDFSPNISSIFGNFINKKFKEKEKVKTEILYNKPDDIIYNINVSFSDIYNLKKKKVIITRDRKKDGLYIQKKKKLEIPIYGKEILLEGEGNEVKNYKERGNVIINIFNKKDINFKRINEYDMLTYKDIEINQLYSAFVYDLVLPHGKVIKVQTEIMKDFMLQKINKNGLPYNDEDDNLCYGNLYILYKIKLPKKFEDLKNIQEYVEKANIDEKYEIAYNCNIDEIFNE